MNPDFSGAKPVAEAPIKARGAAQTGRLGKTRNAEGRFGGGLPFGLEPKRSIAALQILAGSPTQLRFAPGAGSFGPPTHPEKSGFTGPGLAGQQRDRRYGNRASDFAMQDRQLALSMEQLRN